MVVQNPPPASNLFCQLQPFGVSPSAHFSLGVISPWPCAVAAAEFPLNDLERSNSTQTQRSVVQNSTPATNFTGSISHLRLGTWFDERGVPTIVSRSSALA